MACAAVFAERAMRVTMRRRLSGRHGLTQYPQDPHQRYGQGVSPQYGGYVPAQMQTQSGYYGVPHGYGEPAKPHSGMGIASFIISILSGLAMLAMFIVAGFMSVQAGGRMDEKSPEAMAVGCSIMVGIVICVVGLILGLAGLAQKDRKKAFSVLGVIFNGGIVLLVVGLILLGLAMK
jgi:hypothetical protein